MIPRQHVKSESDCIEETNTTRLLPTAAENEEKSMEVVWIVAFKKHHGGALKRSINVCLGSRKQIPEDLGMLGEDTSVNAEGRVFGSGHYDDVAVWKPDFCVLHKLTQSAFVLGLSARPLAATRIGVVRIHGRGI